MANIEINVLSFTPSIDKEHYCSDNCIENVYSFINFHGGWTQMNYIIKLHD